MKQQNASRGVIVHMPALQVPLQSLAPDDIKLAVAGALSDVL